MALKIMENWLWKLRKGIVAHAKKQKNMAEVEQAQHLSNSRRNRKSKCDSKDIIFFAFQAINAHESWRGLK